MSIYNNKLKEIAEGLLRDNSIYWDEIVEYRYQNNHHSQKQSEIPSGAHVVVIDDAGELKEFVFPGVIEFD